MTQRDFSHACARTRAREWLQRGMSLRVRHGGTP